MLNKRKHKATMYWAVRSVLPLHGYEPVKPDGTVFGFVVCQPDHSEKADAHRRKVYAETSAAHPDRLPIWC